MDVLEVELSLERIRASSSDERVKELEESEDNLETHVSELEQQIEELKESTELDLKTLEKVCCEEVTQRDEKIEEQNRKIEELKKSNRLDRENLEMIGREEISQRDKIREEQRKGMELLKRQLKKTGISPDREPGRKSTQSSLIIERTDEQDGDRSEDVHQLDLESICLSDDSEVNQV
jgi:predicted RNase H-like nuclease (RuvC/YqgF family)